MGNFDKIMRENLGKISKGLMRYLLPENAEKATPMPPRVRKTILEKETDNLFLIQAKRQKDSILHLEFQSTNDPQMPLRMAVYNYTAQYMYEKEVISIVIYIGKEELKMQNILSTNGNYYSFQLIDICDIDPELFLNQKTQKRLSCQYWLVEIKRREN